MVTGTETITILFTDLEESTKLLQELGDEKARLLWRTYFRLVRSAATAKGGSEVKSLGDGLMIVFPSARDAIRCAIAIQREIHRHNIRRGERYRLRIRIGLHVGEPIQDEEDYFGIPVIIAKRICDCARGGQVVASEIVRGIVGSADDINFTDLGLSTLKGIPEQWRLYEVPWQREETAAALALATLSERTPFVGREREVEELAQFLSQAAHGQGNLVLIGGEPGVGKTRLAEELLGEGRQSGFLTLSGHCYEMEGTPPYLPFLEILESAIRVVEPEALLEALGDAAPEMAKLMPNLRRLFPDIPPPAELPPEQARRYLFNGICDFMARAGKVQPLFFLIEDLQWADESSLMLVQHCAQHISEVPALIIGTYRDVELDVARSLDKIMQDLLRRRLAYRLDLKRLTEEGVADMLRARSGQQPPSRLVKIIYHETDGNPFFIEEIFRDLAESGKLFHADGSWRNDLYGEMLDVPQGIKLAIGRRLERVSEQCRHALTAAAVIGRDFSFELLEQLTDLEEDILFEAVEVAERAQLIRSTGRNWEAHYAFMHELIRQTLVSGLSLPRRQRLHLRVAEAMERVYAARLDEYATDLAYHLYQAGAAADSVKTAHYLTLAGDRAFATAAFEDALRLHEQALSLQTPDNARPRAELLYKHGLDLRSLNRLEEALADWRESLAAYESLGDFEAVGHVCAELSTYLFSRARFEDAFETALHGLVTLEDRVNPDRCLLLATQGFLLSNIPEAGYKVAEDLFLQALNMAKEIENKRIMGPILGRKAFLHNAYWQGRLAAEVGLECAKFSQFEPYSISYSLAYGGQCGMLWQGRLDEAARIGAEAKQLGMRAGNEHAHWFAGHYDSFREVAATGDLIRFEERRKALLDMELGLGSGWSILSYVSLGRAQFWRGLWREARESLRKGAEADVQGHTAGVSDAILFLLAAYSRDKETSAAILERRRQALPQAGRPNMVASWQLLEAIIEGLAALEEWDEAGALYPLALEAIATGNLVHAGFHGLVQTTAAIAAFACGLWEEAEKHCRTALKQAHQIPYRIEQPEVRRWYARMLIERNASGDKEKARTLLAEAIGLYRQIGMQRHLEMAEELKRKL